jgi:hypothetical protein
MTIKEFFVFLRNQNNKEIYSNHSQLISSALCHGISSSECSRLKRLLDTTDLDVLLMSGSDSQADYQVVLSQAVRKGRFQPSDVSKMISDIAASAGVQLKKPALKRAYAEDYVSPDERTQIAEAAAAVICQSNPTNSPESESKVNDFGWTQYNFWKSECKSDPELAMEALKRSADSGYPAALRELGLCYYYGTNVKANWQMAWERLTVPGTRMDRRTAAAISDIRQHSRKIISINLLLTLFSALLLLSTILLVGPLVSLGRFWAVLFLVLTCASLSFCVLKLFGKLASSLMPCWIALLVLSAECTLLLI